MTATPAVRQEHPRVPLALTVVRQDGQSGQWTTVNVSEGGLLLRGEPLPQGSELDVGIWVPSEGQSVETISRVKVVWNDDHEHSGLKLLDSNPKYQRIVQARLREHRTARPTQRMNSGEMEAMVSPKSPRSNEFAVQLPDFDLLEDEEFEIEIDRDPAESSNDEHQTLQAIGSYRVLDLLGAGGMGEVYLAEHTRLGRRVALKRLHPRYARDERIRTRFLDEGRLTNRVQHPNVVDITDLISEGDDVFYVMEFLEGRALLDDLEAERPLAVPRLLHIGAQLAGALQAVHDVGLVHRDIKPSNVLLIHREGDDDFVKLLDFGIARDDVRNPGHTVEGSIVGTAGFMAPEQLMDADLDWRADIYSLGVVLFQMATGRSPFEGRSWNEVALRHITNKAPRASKFNPLISSALDVLIARCLAKKREQRPASARDVAAALRTLSHRTGSTSAANLAAMELIDDRPRVPAWLTSTGIAGGAAFLASIVTVALTAFPWGERPASTERETLSAHANAPIDESLGRATVASAPPPRPVSITGSGGPAQRQNQPAPPGPKEAVSPTPVKHKRGTQRVKRRRNSADDSAGVIASVVADKLSAAKRALRQKNPKLAVQASRQVLALDATNAAAYRVLGIAYSMLKSRSNACESYRRYYLYGKNIPDKTQIRAILAECDI